MLTNMKQSAKEAQEYCAPTASDAPQYPYGLELRLDEEGLAKLGMTTPPAVGTVMMISARVEVSSASQYQTQGGEAECSSCWQITDLEVTGSPNTQSSAAASLYGGDND